VPSDRHGLTRSVPASSLPRSQKMSLTVRAAPGIGKWSIFPRAGPARTPAEVGTVAGLLMGSDGAFITGSDFLMDGGVTGLLVWRT
jgi:hypothetical protein